MAITGQRSPSSPPTAKQYTAAGYPWFDYYDAEAKAVSGSATLAALKSVFQLGQEKRQSPLPENDSAVAPNMVNLRVNLKPGQVRESNF